MLKASGLSFEFRRSLELLNNALPIPSSKEHSFLSHVDHLINQIREINEDISDDIDRFLKSCREIRRQQFCIKSENIGKDIEKTWLHLLVFGKDWVAIVKEVLGFSLPNDLSSCKIIKLYPHGKKVPLKLSVTLKKEISIPGEEFEQLFYPNIKKAFDIEIHDYSVEEQLLKLKESQCIEIDNEQSSKLVNGTLPKSIQYLLKWSGIEEISIGYPISESIVPQPSDVISNVVVIPACSNSSWKPDAFSPIVSSIAWRSIWNAMELSEQSPVHLIVSSDSPEFYPLIDDYLKGLNECYKYLRNKSVQLINALTLRHITLFEPNFLRSGSEFEYLEGLFEKEFGGAEGHQSQLKVKSDFILNQSDLGQKLFERIGNMYFLKEVIASLEEQGNRARHGITTYLKSYESSKSQDVEGKEISFLKKYLSLETKDQKQAFDAIKYLFLYFEEMLNMVIRNIGFVKMMLSTLVQIEESQKIGWNWLYYKDGKELSEVDKACQFLVRCALNGNEMETRIESLAGVLYLIDAYDEVRDSEPKMGFTDDEYALSHILYSLKQSKIKLPSEIDKWLLNRLGKIDKLLGKDLQKKVEKRLKLITKVLSQLSKHTSK